MFPGWRFPPLSGHHCSKSSTHGDPSGEGEPGQTSQVHDPNGSVLCALPHSIIDRDRLLLL